MIVNPYLAFPQALGADSRAFQAYCEKMGLDRKAILKATPGVVAPRVVPAAEAAGGGGGGGGPRVTLPRVVKQAAGAVALVPRRLEERAARWACPDCGEEVTPTQNTMLVKGNHRGKCGGSGARKPVVAISE